MRLTRLLIAVLFIIVLGECLSMCAQDRPHDGLANSLDNLYRISDAKTRSIRPENLTGVKGKGGMASQNPASDTARDPNQSWKSSPFAKIEPGRTLTLAEINGEGAIQHIWITPGGPWRLLVLRMYWDDETEPSVESPVGDFFAMGWGKYTQVSSLAVCVNPGSAFNSYWVMPFRKKAKLTLQNVNDKAAGIYYRIDYTLAQVPRDAAYFHAQFRGVKLRPIRQPYTIVDGIKGRGQYVGTYLAWGVEKNGWWGDGQIAFYVDGDSQFPTINGTGTEDYFGGSYNFEDPETKQYQTFNTPYSGLIQVIEPEGVTQTQQRFGLYRWHIPDPVRFERDLKVSIRPLGWRSAPKGVASSDAISSVAFWYQVEPHAPFPKLPNKVDLEVN